MARIYQALAMSAVLVTATGAFAGDWVQFTEQTGARLVSDPSLGASDTEEKDYAWGDVDKDGDIDLVVVRKEIGSTPGRRRNVLFMNEDGVLTDRTDDYATAADDGGEGFLDMTNDRDVALVDVDGDGWLDIVTVTTYGSQQLPKSITHPRIYLNLQEEAGVWQGFEYQEARFPELTMIPFFCGVGFGDVTGDGAPDLFFNDYLNSLENRLLINNGSGVFTDETEARFAGNGGFLDATFSVHSEIADLNHDGYNDIVNALALGPYEVAIAYNDPGMEGFFTAANTETIAETAVYFVAVDDLNNDGLLDIVEGDDAVDRYFLNQGNGADGKANWLTLTLPNSGQDFDNNIVIADLDNDGFKDILIADVDADLPYCTGRLDIHRNLANPPIVTFDEDVGNLPTNNNGPLRGTHDVAVFDIDGDCWLDLVIGNCDGTTVWINQGEGNICDETNITVPDDYSIFRGMHDSGVLADVLDADNVDLCHSEFITIFPGEAPVTLDFDGTLANDSPASLDVTFESSANTPSLEITISFWNYNTNSWDIVGTAVHAFLNDAVHTFAGTPADHVESGTGNVRTRYEVRKVGPVITFPFVDCIDQFFWTTTN